MPADAERIADTRAWLTKVEADWAFRYPGDAAAPVRSEVEAALVVARALVSAVGSRLPQATPA